MMDAMMLIPNSLGSAFIMLGLSFLSPSTRLRTGFAKNLSPQNSKSHSRNSKQARINQARNLSGLLCLEHWRFKFVSDFDIRISDFFKPHLKNVILSGAKNLISFFLHTALGNCWRCLQPSHKAT